jgi:hypothetical protein
VKGPPYPSLFLQNAIYLAVSEAKSQLIGSN